MILIMKEIRHIICGIFYCRDFVEINGSGSFQTSCRFDKDSASKSATKTYRQSVVRHTFFIFLYGGFSLRFKNKEAKQIFFLFLEGI